MPARKLMTSVLRGFLGTYLSRYSDLDGYLVFGLATDCLGGLEVDLTSEPPGPSFDPEGELRRLAIRRFNEQLAKVHLPVSVVHDARLTCRRGSAVQIRLQVIPGDVPVEGHDYVFCAQATTDLGRTYREERHVFIAPCDSEVFRRSGRRGCA
jgi:hypothetical protein